MSSESILKQGFAIVVDIGKSLCKVTLWARDGRMLDRQVRPNVGCEIDGIRRLDADGGWLVEALTRYRGEPVSAIVPVAHGAGAVALSGDGLAFAPLDYEQTIPAHVLTAYRAERDPFAVTGSPALPGGLNIGSQLYWLDRLYPEATGDAVLVPWAQYWAWFLSGKAVSEVTSLGCHSDLWCPAAATYSPMAQRLGWAQRFAPLFAAGDAVGTLRPELATATGLPDTARILTGLHDSNAALLAARGFSEVAACEELTVLSTGTWFVGMRVPAMPVSPSDMAEARDCLMNVDVLGSPVPSARFMGGREIELLGARIDWPGVEGAADVLAAGTMVLPSQVRGCGPFPQSTSRWMSRPHDPARRSAAVALYVALMADSSLDLIGAREALIIEGRFAASEIFTRALAALRPQTRVFTAGEGADVSFGALRLLSPALAPQDGLHPVAPLAGDLAKYRDEWRRAIRAFA